MTLYQMMASLPQPSAVQYAEFARHICTAHSWYKHIPLAGGLFVVFLAQDAGVRYPLLHPRLGTGENSAALYRERFGHLDYIWRTDPAQPFDRDGGEPPDLPTWFLDRFGMTLYPYASEDWSTIQVICSAHHREAMDQLRSGASHPARERLLRMVELYNESTAIWSGLTEEECEMACDVDDEVPDDLPAAVKNFLKLDASCQEIHNELQTRELAKVEGTLGRLKAWLTS